MQEGSATDHEGIADDASAPVNYTEWYRERFGDSRVWLMSPGINGMLWNDFKGAGIASVGWADIGDLRNYKSQKEILDALMETGEYERRATNIARGLRDFSWNMKIGDKIIARHGTKAILGVGKVIGDYVYGDSSRDHRHTRAVKWDALEQPVSIPVGNRGIAKKTLTDFTPYKDWLYIMFRLIDRVTPVDQYEPYTVQDALTDLFVRDEHFNRILGMLKLRKNLILQGPPGTGKTFMARRLAWCLIGSKDSRSIEMVQFHQSYAYEDFVQGYRPTETGGFTLRHGVFYRFCERARGDKDTQYVFIIDEINRGNISRIFGELLMLIEADKREKQYAASLTYGAPSERFYVPPNVYILGMMNTADRSLAVVDYALRRRFAFEDLAPAFGNHGPNVGEEIGEVKFGKHLGDNGVDEDTIGLIQRRMTALNEKIRKDAELGPGFEIGHSYFVRGGPEEIGDKAHDWYVNIVKTQIAPLLRQYWFDSLEKAEEEISKLRAKPVEEQ